MAVALASAAKAAALTEESPVDAVALWLRQLHPDLARVARGGGGGEGPIAPSRR